MSYEIRTAPAPFVCRFLVWLWVVRGTDVARNLKMAAPYVVHEAGELAGLTQRCRRCGALLFDAVQHYRMGDPEWPWGFPVGRRVVVTPDCTYLVTSDRQLAGDEVSCQ